MNFQELPIKGCYLFDLKKLNDRRGSFLKTFHQPSFADTPLRDFVLREEFYTISNKQVFRGLHFQAPPAAHDKLVICVAGQVLDVILDIRRQSPTYGQWQTLPLSADIPQLLLLPKGIAHGFLAQVDHSALLYKTNHEYSPEHDSGILWSTLGLALGVDPAQLIVSERDNAFPSLDSFRSPF